MNQSPSGQHEVRGAASVTQRPKPIPLLFHVGKTARLASALMRDPRISIFRKLFFFAVIFTLVAVLLAGDAAAEVVSNILPFIGPIVNIPADATIDWVVIALAATNLLGIFPAAIVSEHYDRLFHGPKITDGTSMQLRR